MKAGILSLASVVLVSFVSLVGVLVLKWSADRVRRFSRFLISFAIGALLGDAFIHLLPEAFRAPVPPLQVSLSVLAGMLGLFSVEQLLRVRPDLLGSHALHGVRPVVSINLIGDALHNLIDGILIGASYLVSVELGVSTTLAVLLHEIPQELGDFGILVHAGLPVRKAVLFNLLSATMAIVGTVAVLVAGAQVETLGRMLVPVTAGGFLYIATADLIPELHHERTTWATFGTHFALMTGGIAVMVLLTGVE